MKLSYLIVAGCAVLSLGSCAKKDGGADSAMKMKADSMKAAYTAISAAWDAGKTDEFGKYIADNVVDHDPMPGAKPGLAGMKEMAGMMKTWYPDMKSTIEDMRVEGDVISVRFKSAGTNSGAMMGMPATNKKMSDVEGIEMMRWENGKFVEHWGVFDVMKMMQQLGMMPAPGAHPEGDMSKPMDEKGGADKKKM
ncbi:MAG: ester cyclase [Ignavibacteriota bacterium]